MNTVSRISLSIFLLGIFFQSSLAQMEVIDGNTPPVDPVSLINNIFLGDGVEVLNVNYTGDAAAVGLFTNGEDAVGLDRGIVMTTGRAASPNCGAVLGANCNGTQFASNDNQGPGNDPDLNAVSGLTTMDLASFTITFIPTADTLRFRYVFASEEYPEYACTQFNDAFGFFLSGPGIAGPYSNGAENIALIPGTDIPVSINNVNGNGMSAPWCDYDYSNFYNDNQVNQQPVYDAYLDVFTAEYVVTPCETYTMKLAVADGSDAFFDTGVFLEAKSFGTGSLQVETATVSLDGTITEGCSDGTITFNLPNPATEDFMLDYTIIGDAVNGEDYLEVPLDLFIPTGDSSISINIVAIEDAIDEGLESIGIDIQRDICNRDTFWIYIRDNEIVPPELGPDTLICAGDSVNLDGTLPIPLPPPPSFSNTQDYFFDDTAPVFSPINVVGVQPVILQEGVIQSVCLNIDHSFTDDVDIFLVSPGGQFLELSTDNGQDCDDFPNTCFTPTATTLLTDIIPVGYDCAGGESTTFTGDFMAEGIWEDLWDGEFPTNGQWQLLVSDDAMGFNGSLLDWTITFEPLYQVFYEWSPADGLSCSDCPDPVASPTETTTYTLTAWDTYGCQVTDSITIEVNEVLPAPNITCVNVSDNSITFEWNDVPGAMGYQVSVDGATFTVPNNGPVSHIVNGLTLGTTVTIEVFAIGQCDGEIGTATCETPSCDAPALNIVSQTTLLCAGDSNAEIQVEASGGTGTYTYSLDGISNTTGFFDNLSAGVYEVSAVDDLMCPIMVQVNIGEPDSMELEAVNLNEISCFGLNDGSATAVVNGGTAPYSFNWSNGETDSIATAIQPGLTTLEVTDVNGCAVSVNFDFSEPPILTATTTTDSVDCFTASTGSATVIPSGGTEPWIYEWDANAGNATTAEVNDLSAGTYDVVVTDLNGCQITTSATIGQPDGMTTQLTSTDASCANSADGTATVEVTGGAPDYTFEWSNGENTQTANSLDAVNYTVTVTDANGCSVQDSITVNGPAAIEILLEKTDVLCFNGNSGTITSTVMGGNGNFSYMWSNGSDVASPSNLAAGDYCLTVTDGNGCSEEACIFVDQADEYSLDSNVDNAGCNGGASGAIDISISGATPPYNFLWSTGETTEDISGLASGMYTLTVTDENQCQFAWNFTVNESDAVELSTTQTDVLCFGENTGSIDLTASGGIGGFSYQWSGPGGFTSDEADPTDLTAGTYSIIVEDLDGCTAQTQVEILQPNSPVEVDFSAPSEICFGANNGSVSAVANGGTPDYDFAWSNGANTSNNNNLTAGNYTVSVTDANQCLVEATIEIIQQSPIEVELSQNPAACFGGTDGEASIVSISQGGFSLPTPDVEIEWSNGNGQPDINGLTGGQTYSVTVTNDLGCTGEAEITIGNPPEIGAALVNSTDASCFGGNDGTANVAGEGGTQPYSYQWDANAANQTNATATDLSMGNYLVTITDVEGCSTQFEVAIGEPTALGLSFQTERVSCYGESDGAATAFAEGGTSPYSFVWENGQAGAENSDLPAGNWLVTLTDNNGCEFVESVEVIQPDEPVLATYSTEDVTCHGLRDGRINIFAEGGSPPYRYSLNGNDFMGTPSFIALMADEYNVVVRDNEGCTFEINDIFITEPEEISIDLGPDTTVWYGYNVVIDVEYLGINDSQIVNLDRRWSSNNPLSPIVYPKGFNGVINNITSPTTMKYSITTENGCTAEDLINIYVREFRSVQVPTGFAPGGNSPRNGALHVHGKSQMVENVNLFQVFDRWGELMYEAEDFGINDESIGWDGTFKGSEMPPGVYIWFLEVEFVDGDVLTYKGETTLIR